MLIIVFVSIFINIFAAYMHFSELCSLLEKERDRTERNVSLGSPQIVN